MKKVIIYTSDYCSYCDMAKSLLSRENILFNEINISQNDQLKEEMVKKSGGRKTVPQIFIGTKHIGGYDDLNQVYLSQKLTSFL